ncbi:CDGSH iron-sulfur domain-containing protein [Haloarcula marina]|uniref:CDGSH iron-sulfur domain-containing protein n=1 Tax=Haloarcula marina TaxID=2961574 RepID=UPI0020B6A5F2|nr:CDGSH iron-sulfur domain-containing protein [Halomicroarcula marina]
MEEDIHHYDGEDVDVTFDSNRCIHVRECVEGLPAVFDTSKRPWVDPNEASPDAVADVVERCPTGALHYERADGTPEPVPDRNTVTATAQGPVYVRGDATVTDEEGETLLEDTRLALCRCGHSMNKPLCDNSHARVFDAVGVEWRPDDVSADDDAATAAAGTQADELTITATEDGPFRLDGPFDLVSGSGRESRTEAWLCRCGGSANKPFCDGTHAEIGFDSE